MKLSEAILLGSIGTEQAFGMYRDHDGNTCALGSAFAAVGVRFDSNFGLHFDRSPETCPPEWKWIFNEISVIHVPEINTHSGCFRYHNTTPIWAVIPYLNDTCKWPRPRIAEWVKTMEAIYDPDHAPQPVKEVEYATT